MVSIVICSYNSAGFLAETLNSVMAQTFQDFEVLLVNDGSTDNTDEVVQPYIDRIEYIKQENGGPAKARNTGLRAATRKYIAILDSDDIWMPNYLERMLGVLEADQSIDLIFPNAEFFEAPEWEGKFFQDYFPATLPVTLQRLVRRDCYVFISSTFRRALLDRPGVGGFDESLKGMEDFDLWLRMLIAGAKMSFLRESLVRYRVRSGSLSKNNLGMTTGLVKLYDKLLSFQGLSAAERAAIEAAKQRTNAKALVEKAKQELASGNVNQALASLTEARKEQNQIKLGLICFALRYFPSLVLLAYSRRAAQ